jgi:cation transport ATPase
VPVTAVSIIGRSSQIVDHRRWFKKTDRHRFVKLFIQVILLALLTIPVAIQKLYATLTTNVKNLIYEIIFLETYITTGMRFYVNNYFRRKTILCAFPFLETSQMIIINYT